MKVGDWYIGGGNNTLAKIESFTGSGKPKLRAYKSYYTGMKMDNNQRILAPTTEPTGSSSMYPKVFMARPFDKFRVGDLAYNNHTWTPYKTFYGINPVVKG